MTALPVSAGESAVREAVERLSAIAPGPYEVVSCYLKLEPRDKARAKYLIKIKNRIKQRASDLERRPLDHAQRESVRADLDRLRRYFEERSRLPAARGIALFACGALDLFDVLPLPHVHRSRLAVAPVPLVRELLALEEEFGTILVVACDRASARFFAVTAYDVAELSSLTALSTRAGKFHGERQAKKGSVLAGGFGEHNYHMRIREERQRHYAQVADRIFQIHAQRPLAGLVVAGIGVDAAALLPHLHTYLHDLVLGVVRLNPKRVTAAEVREAALSLREERERAWERAHAEAVREGVGSGWAVNGIEPTLKALERGQVRTLLADGQDDDRRIDDAIEEALAQHVQVDVVYDERARRVVDGLAGLERQDLERALRTQVTADLERVQGYFAESTRLPAARGIALFACGTFDLFEVLPLPHVHRSRLAVAPVPLVRELVALEEEFGTILVAACDRTSARFFEVTA